VPCPPRVLPVCPTLVGYLRLAGGALDQRGPTTLAPGRVVFVCTANSARSHLAAALWRQASAIPSASAGTHPAERIDPAAIDVAHRHGLPLPRVRPRHLDQVVTDGDLVVTVCDLAHEELGRLSQLHWSIPDPVRVGTNPRSTPPTGRSRAVSPSWPGGSPPPRDPHHPDPSPTEGAPR
jgi:protein-tyrosine-phosphatase